MRRRRFAFFLSLLSLVKRPVRILDVGGTPEFSQLMGLNQLDNVRITILNLQAHPVPGPLFDSVAGTRPRHELPATLGNELRNTLSYLPVRFGTQMQQVNSSTPVRTQRAGRNVSGVILNILRIGRVVERYEIRPDI
jgi:hypothetical protein